MRNSFPCFQTMLLDELPGDEVAGALIVNSGAATTFRRSMPTVSMYPPLSPAGSIPYSRSSAPIYVAATSSSCVPLPRPCKASLARNSICARMQSAHSFGGGEPFRPAFATFFCETFASACCAPAAGRKPAMTAQHSKATVTQDILPVFSFVESTFMNFMLFESRMRTPVVQTPTSLRR